MGAGAGTTRGPPLARGLWWGRHGEARPRVKGGRARSSARRGCLGNPNGPKRSYELVLSRLHIPLMHTDLLIPGDRVDDAL